MSFEIPTLETDRLILRAPRLGDQGAIAAFGASGRTEYIGGPIPADQAWGVLLRISGHWHIRGFGSWFLTLKGGDDTAIGWCGGIYHLDWPEAELGWSIFSDEYEGKGLAAEAAIRVRQEMATRYDLPAPISVIDPANTRSVALAHRLGAHKEYELELRGHHCHIYRHPDVRGAE